MNFVNKENKQLRLNEKTTFFSQSSINNHFFRNSLSTGSNTYQVDATLKWSIKACISGYKIFSIYFLANDIIHGHRTFSSIPVKHNLIGSVHRNP